MNIFKRCIEIVALRFTLVVLFLFIHVAHADDFAKTWEDNFTSFPKSLNDLSVLTPSGDSRIIYVDPDTGNDSTATHYAISSVLSASMPEIDILPFKTIAAANAAARAGYPDWILLKRGTSNSVIVKLDLMGGRSKLERLVLSSYGPTGTRPILNVNLGAGIRVWKERSFVAIRGLRIYSVERDPTTSKFIGWENIDSAGNTGIEIVTGTNSVLIEDNIISHFSNNLSITGSSTSTDIVIRKNYISYAHSNTKHAQGMYAINSELLVEDNVLDHNGWINSPPDEEYTTNESYANKFNHNIYFSGLRKSLLRGNILSRPSSIHVKLTSNSKQDQDTVNAWDVSIYNNLLYEGEFGFSIGGNSDKDTGPRWKNFNVSQNILYGLGRANATKRNLAWYIVADDWTDGQICDNILLSGVNSDVPGTLGIAVTGHANSLRVVNNQLIGFEGSVEDQVYSKGTDIQNSVVFSDNTLTSTNPTDFVTFEDAIKSIGHDDFLSLIQSQENLEVFTTSDAIIAHYNIGNSCGNSNKPLAPQGITIKQNDSSPSQ